MRDGQSEKPTAGHESLDFSRAKGALPDAEARDRHLRSAEEECLRLRSLVDSMDQGFCIIEVLFDAQGIPCDYRFLETNPAFVRQTGLTDAVGKTVRELVPAHEAHWFERYGRIAMTGHAERFEEEAAALGRYYEVSAFRLEPAGERKVAVFFYDVAERKQTEEALRASEALFRTLADTIPALIWQNDAGGGNLFINRYFLDYTGRSEEEIQGDGWHSLVHPDEAEAYIAGYMTAVREHRSWHDRNRIRRHDGQWHWFDNFAQPLFGQDGTYLGHVGVSTDINAAIEAQDAVRKSEELLRTVLANSRDGINMLDLSTGRYVFMNDAQVALTGFTQEEINEISSEEAHDRVHPDDRHISVEQHRRIAAGEDEDEPVEYRWKVKSGEYRWFSDRRKLVRDDAGKPVALVGISRDITRRRKVEETLRASEERQAFLLELSDALRPLADPVEIEGTLTRIALDFFRADRCYYCSIEDEHAVIRRDARRSDLPSVAGSYGLDELPIFKAVIHAGRPFVVRDAATSDLLDETLRRLCLELQIISFIDVPVIKAGEPVGILCITQCEERAWTEAQVHVATEVAERAWAAVDRARAMAAVREREVEKAAEAERSRLARDLHDSVTQALFAATLRTEALSLAAGEDKPAVAAAAEEVGRLNRGALAQMRTMLLELRGDPIEEVPLIRLLRNLAEAAESRCAAKVVLTAADPVALPAPIHVAIYRIAQEALNNVVRHARAASVRIELEHQPGTVRLQVADDGKGFDVDRVEPGHYGLTSMRERAAEVGAELDVRSSPGRGTVVTFTARTG